jgi:triphosphoribosyl-dephospho-CoA synthase
MLRSEKLAQYYQEACIEELQALKPGNVHIFADGHGMQVTDFIKSAEASAFHISKSDVSVGERIANAVKATYAAVGMNTNLGIILLCAPLIHAAKEACLTQENLQHTLGQLTVQDAQLVAKAIVLANPAGLNSADAHDVRDTPQVTLLEMMRSAQDVDRVAWQYAHQFGDIFDSGLSYYQEAMGQWQNTMWAATWIYINFLCQHLDTHVTRKHGEALAHILQNEARDIKSQILSASHPKHIKKTLYQWDASLKARKINPGTSADLTVATLLVVKLM